MEKMIFHLKYRVITLPESRSLQLGTGEQPMVRGEMFELDRALPSAGASHRGQSRWPKCSVAAKGCQCKTLLQPSLCSTPEELCFRVRTQGRRHI